MPYVARRRVYLAVLCCTLLFTTIALAQTTLETVKSRGKLVCGVNTGLAGFATVGPDGKWHGFDVDYCRALAAAIFNDAEKVEFRPLTTQTRFTALQAKEIGSLVISGVHIILKNKGNIDSRGNHRMCQSGYLATLHIMQ